MPWEGPTVPHAVFTTANEKAFMKTVHRLNHCCFGPVRESKYKKRRKKTSRLLFFKTQVIKLFSESLQRGACSSPATPCFTFTRQTRIRSGSSAGEPRVCFSSSSSYSCYGAEQVHGSRLETRVCSACWTHVGVEGMTGGGGGGEVPRVFILSWANFFHLLLTSRRFFPHVSTVTEAARSSLDSVAVIAPSHSLLL